MRSPWDSCQTGVCALPPRSPNFIRHWAKSPLSLAGPDLSSPTSKGMPGRSAVGAVIVPVSIPNPSLKDSFAPSHPPQFAAPPAWILSEAGLAQTWVLGLGWPGPELHLLQPVPQAGGEGCWSSFSSSEQ